MPEWLKALLAAQGSLGFADSLATLVGGHPSYSKLPSQTYQGLPVGGGYFVDSLGNHTIGLTPETIQDYARTGTGSYPGYKTVDSQQKSGDRVLGHEFGHIARYAGMGNGPLSDALAPLMPMMDESAADDFQQAVQFLRSGTTDVKKLNSRTKKITEVLLAQPLYSEHSINKQRAFASMVNKQ